MSTILLIVIYISFIGLGIPDSLFGTAWPAIYSEFQIPISYASVVTTITCIGTIVSSMFSARLIKRFGTNVVSAVSTALTAVGLFGFLVSGNIMLLCLFAIPLGIGAGAIDTALNNYVALHYSATHMSFLHCFYGVGVTVSPFLLSIMISGKYGWRGGYGVAFGIQIGIVLILFLSLPIWKKAHGQNAYQTGTAEPREMKALSFRETLRIPGVKLMCCMFVTSCAIECTCGGWGSTFLVEYKNVSVDRAAGIVTFYYVGMTLGRFLSGVVAAKLNSWTIIRIGQIILGVALVILLLPLSASVSAIGFFLVGLGNGPLFPNFNYLTPQNFGAAVSQSVMGTQMATAYIGVMIAPVICGLLGQAFGMGIFPIYIMLFYIVMIAATIRIKRVLRVEEQA